MKHTMTIQEFFKQKSIWVSDRFKEDILKYSKKTIPAIGLNRNIIPRMMTDTEIIKEFKVAPMSIDTFLTTIMDLIEKQPNGEDGPMLTNWELNIFYVTANDTRTLSVRVGWRDSQWQLHCYEFDVVDSWFTGSVVFSPGIEPLPDLSSLEDRIEKLEAFVQGIKSL